MIDEMSGEQIVEVWKAQGELFDSKISLEAYGREVSSATGATAMVMDAKKMLDAGIQSAKSQVTKRKKVEDDDGDRRAALAEVAEQNLREMSNCLTTGKFKVLTDSFIQVHDSAGTDLNQELYNDIDRFVDSLNRLQTAGATPSKFKPASDVVEMLQDLLRATCSVHMRAYEKGKSLGAAWSSKVFTQEQVNQRIEDSRPMLSNA
eukprot:4924666-Amphidinium_carterae.2